MPVQALTQVDLKQFFNLPSTNGTETQRLDNKVSGVAVSNGFPGRVSVTTAEGDTITLSANLESDFCAVNDKSHVEGDCYIDIHHSRAAAWYAIGWAGLVARTAAQTVAVCFEGHFTSDGFQQQWPWRAQRGLDPLDSSD